MDIQSLFYIAGVMFFFVGSVLLIFFTMLMIFVARSAYKFEKEMNARIASLESGVKDFTNNFSGALFSFAAFIAKILKNR
jgi:uncharacterized membrane protein YjgN (DUF898 family)